MARAEESVIVSEVSSFQRLKCMQEWHLGWEKVSCLERCKLICIFNCFCITGEPPLEERLIMTFDIGGDGQDTTSLRPEPIRCTRQGGSCRIIWPPPIRTPDSCDTSREICPDTSHRGTELRLSCALTDHKLSFF